MIREYDWAEVARRIEAGESRRTLAETLALVYALGHRDAQSDVDIERLGHDIFLSSLEPGKEP